MGVITGRIVGSTGPTALPVPSNGTVVENVTALRALTGDADNPAAALKQRASGNDRGGGMFVWDDTAGTDDNHDRLNAGGTGSSGAGWQRIHMHDERPVSVRDFASGAIGNGENADAAIAAAQVFRRTNGRSLLFPCGRYVITTGLEIDDANAADIGTAVRGQNSTDDTVGSVANRQTIIEYAGTGGNILRVRSRGVRIEGIGFRVQSGKSADAGIVWDKGTQTATKLEIVGCQIIAGASLGLGTCTDGVVFGPTAGVNNMDYGRIERCYLYGFSTAAVNIKSTTGQSKGHHFEDSVIGGAQYGILTTSGSFVGYNLHIGYATVASFGIGSSTDYIQVFGSDSENSAKVLKYTGGAALGLPWPVAFYGGRWSLSDTADEWYVDWAWSLLTLQNILFSYAGTWDPLTRGKVRVGVRRDANHYVGSIFSAGNVYLQPTPWATNPVGGTPAYADVTTIADRWQAYTGSGPYSPGNMATIPSDISRRIDSAGTAETRRTYSISRFSGDRWQPSTVAFFDGAGSPESAVTGNVGDLYQDTTNGLQYVKASGAGTDTGWLATVAIAPVANAVAGWDDTGAPVARQKYYTVPIISTTTVGALSLTTHPNSEQGLANDDHYNQRGLYLDQYTQFRLHATVTGNSTSANTPVLYVQVSDDDSAWSDIDAGPATVSLATTGRKVTAWTDIDNAVNLADCYLRVAQNGGDGAEEPFIRDCWVEFR